MQEEVVTCTGAPPAEETVTCTDEAPAPPVAAGGFRAGDAAIAAGAALLAAFVLVLLRRKRQALGAYLAGAGLGVVTAISMLAFRRPVGISGGFDALAGGRWSWTGWIVAGVFLGGMLSALVARRWRLVLGTPRRWLLAFVAGAVIQVGASLAGGCTSGLALSGGVVLSPGAFVFMAAMFGAGIPTAFLVHGRRRRWTSSLP